MSDSTTISISLKHAKAIRHASVELNMTVKLVVEKMVEGDNKVIKSVQKYFEFIS